MSNLCYSASDWIPAGSFWYIPCCVGIRILEGMSRGSVSTTIYSIGSIMFSDRQSFIMMIWEIAAGLGFMIGPLIGSVFFEIGGFKLPFLVIASLFFVFLIITKIVLPKSLDIVKSEANTDQALQTKVTYG